MRETVAAKAVRFNTAARTDHRPRCRLLDTLGNRCPEAELDNSGLCVRHLGQAVRDFYRLTEGQTITIRPDPQITVTDRRST